MKKHTLQEHSISSMCVAITFDLYTDFQLLEKHTYIKIKQ